MSVYNMKQQQRPVQSHPSVTFVQHSLKIGSRDYVLLFFWQVNYYKNYHLIEHTVSIKVIAKWFVIFTNNFNQFISSKMCEKFPNLWKKKFYASFIIPYVCLIWCNNKCRPLKHPATRLFYVWKSTSLCPFVCLLN